jgi:hypothetical protein
MHDVNLQDTTEFKDRLRMAASQQIGDLSSTELTAARLFTLLAGLKVRHVTDQSRDKGLAFRNLRDLNDSNERWRTFFFWCVILGTVLISLNKARDFIRNSRNP